MEYFTIIPFCKKEDAFGALKESGYLGQVIKIPDKLGTAIYSHAINENGKNMFTQTKIIVKDETNE